MIVFVASSEVFFVINVMICIHSETDVFFFYVAILVFVYGIVVASVIQLLLWYTLTLYEMHCRYHFRYTKKFGFYTQSFLASALQKGRLASVGRLQNPKT
jgi:hypothetical protein